MASCLQWMPISFRPPEDRILTTDELACAVYIFGPDLKFQVNREITVPQISKFRIVEPSDLPQQRKGSNDCGIWVAQWMKECRWTDNFGITVNDNDRMKLAIDLVSKEFNMNKSEVMDKAHAYMKDILQKQSRLQKDI
ncbi:hypothetical protein HN51_048428 [Arachis hypogaea]